MKIRERILETLLDYLEEIIEKKIKTYRQENRINPDRFTIYHWINEIMEKFTSTINENDIL